ncbi:acyltransferase [Planktotalea sp.]|uniref:acyltransferase n=1 Tax=Planktotalea sp. TaxID=2029877 RepID=UPI003D6A4126
MKRSIPNLTIRALHTAARRSALAWRWIWYQLTVFVWDHPISRDTRFYGRLRTAYVPANTSTGRGCGFGHNVFLSAGRGAKITLGAQVTVNDGCLLVASESIEIGDRVAIGEYVSIRDQQHIHTAGKGVRDQGYKVAPVTIGANTWIGRGAFIGPGTHIGKDCVIAANSVVHGTFPDGVLIAGAPATLRKSLSDDTGSAADA